MRRFLGGLLVAGIFVFGNSTQAIAQKTLAGGELNHRIQALRERLQNFQARRAGNSNNKIHIDDAELILDQFEAKEEKVVEELEGRSDVAVTILFHDSDAIENAGKTENTEGGIDNPDSDYEQVLVGQNAEPVISETTIATLEQENATDSAMRQVQFAVAANPERADSRLRRYEDLRQRVYLATRMARSQAADISRQIARLP